MATTASSNVLPPRAGMDGVRRMTGAAFATRGGAESFATSASQECMGVHARWNAAPSRIAATQGVANGTARVLVRRDIRVRRATCAKRATSGHDASTSATPTRTASAGGGAQRQGNASAKPDSMGQAVRRAL